MFFFIVFDEADYERLKSLSFFLLSRVVNFQGENGMNLSENGYQLLKLTDKFYETYLNSSHNATIFKVSKLLAL